jgi:hypothetical protein
MQVFTAGREEGYTLHVHTADGVGWIHPAILAACSGRGCTLHIYIHIVERNTPCTSTLQGLFIDTPCMATLQAM